MTALKYIVTALVAFGLGAVLFMSGGLLAKSDVDMISYKPVDVSKWKPSGSASAMAVLEPLFAAHPSRMEGNPTLKIDIKPSDGKLIAIVELTGFLDDSVDGSRHRAEIESTPDGKWELTKLGAAHRCARAMENGWTTKPCP